MKRILTIVLAMAMLFVWLPGCGKKKEAASGPILNGISIGEYTIVYSQDAPDYCLRAAQYIQSQVKERTGLDIAVCEAASGTYAHEILVGATNRSLSQNLNSKSRKTEFYFTADDNHIAMNGDYFVIAAAAYYFVETYIPGAEFNTAIPTNQITAAQPITAEPSHFIFLIGDGMGFNQTKLIGDMEMGEFAEDSDLEDIFYGYYLPYQGSIRTASLSGITDSAAGATALACGYKTMNHYVGKDKDGNDLQSLTELAYTLNMATAVMSTDQMNGATPAGFSAHALDRDDTETLMVGVQQRMAEGTIISCGLHSDPEYQDEITRVLNELDKNENGFFMMYEEGYIDKFCHNNVLEDAFSAVIRFNQAIGLFMEYAFYHPDTFVVITADHETGGLTKNSDGQWEFLTTNHTGADVPVFAYGQGAEVFKDYDQENTEICKVIAALWGVNDFGDQG